MGQTNWIQLKTQRWTCEQATIRQLVETTSLLGEGGKGAGGALEGVGWCHRCDVRKTTLW